MTSQRQTTTLPTELSTNADLSQTVASHLASKCGQPTQAWLQDFLSSARPNTPINSLQQTALFRLLGTDITHSIQSSPGCSLPTGIADPNIVEQRIPGPITVQILDVEDIGRSRWSQVEAIEARERGEMTKGREVVRVVPEEGNAPPGPDVGNSKSHGPHKLLLQDARGTRVYALELRAIGGIDVDMAIGCKLVLRHFTIARGVVLLEAKHVEFLGGKVEAWDKKWKEDRKRVLMEKAGVGVST